MPQSGARIHYAITDGGRQLSRTLCSRTRTVLYMVRSVLAKDALALTGAGGQDRPGRGS